MKNTVYTITNVINGKLYIGSSINYKKRKLKHLCHLRSGKHHSPILQTAYNKYGEESFIFNAIEHSIDPKNMLEREQHYIDTLKPYYNCSPTAGSPLGVKHTDEARKNMSNAHLKLTEKQRNHKKDCRCFACNPIRKNTTYWLGKSRSKETKEKLGKPITQMNMNNDFIKEWIGASDAAKTLGLSQSHISGCCRGIYGRKSIGGFKWKFKN